jgi:2Fe-2S ferredoxin
MVRVTYITFDGKEQTVDVEAGYSLMEGAVKNSVIGIDADCGGNCYCGTCKVFVTPAWREKLGGQNNFEEQLLDSIGETEPTVRLSCQIKVTEAMDGLVVRLPKAQK